MVHAGETEGYGFIEFEISNSTVSTVFRQPLVSAMPCPRTREQRKAENQLKKMEDKIETIEADMAKIDKDIVDKLYI